MQLIYSGGMFTDLHVTRYLAIGYDSCGSDLRYVRSWIIAILSRSRTFPVFCDLKHSTSHLLAVYSYSAHCVGFEKCKGKGFPNKSSGLR